MTGNTILIDNGMSKEDRLRSIKESKLRESIEKEFTNQRKEIGANLYSVREGDLKIMQMKEYWGKQEFKKKMNFIISEHGKLIGMWEEPWWKCLHRDMVHEELDKQLNTKS